MTPWTPSNGPARHTKKAKSAKSKREWADVANSVLAKTGDEGRAVREANGVVKHKGSKIVTRTSGYNWRD